MSSFHPSSGAAQGIKHKTDTRIASVGQTEFSLSLLPVDPADVTLVVNGLTTTNNVDFTIAGKTLTWLETEYALVDGDVLRIDYDGFEDQHRTENFVVAMEGQTEFTLVDTPVDPTDVTLVMNGQVYLGGVDYTVVGNVVTWLNTDFALNAGDRLRIDFDVLNDRIQTDEFIAVAGQTEFVLTRIPTHPEDIVVSVNGFVALLAQDFTVTGNVVTWFAFEFALGDGDQVRIEYET